MKFFMRLFKRKNGYWYYSKARGHERSLKTKSKREAQRLYNIIKKEYLKGRLVQLDSNKQMSLKEFKDVFFTGHTDISDDTTDAYDLAYRLFIDSIGGTTLLSRINQKHLNKFKTDCLSRGCRKTSVNTYLRHLRGIFNKAFEWGYIDKKIKVVFYRIGKRHPRVLTDDEISNVLTYAKSNDPEMFRIIQFALWTGARRSEITRLK